MIWLRLMMIVGVVIGVIASISGMYFSYFYNLLSGIVIVLVASELSIVPFLFSPRQSLLTQSFLRY